MATLDRDDILSALAELGQLAAAEELEVELTLLGGAVMVLGYGARQSTRDVDAVILSPAGGEARIRKLVEQVAAARDWPPDWLNDAAKGYLVGISLGAILYAGPGLVARAPTAAQMLAMKLSAWRDDVDISDARRLLQAVVETGLSREASWAEVERFLVPGDELTAQYAFLDLWENLYGDA